MATMLPEDALDVILRRYFMLRAQLRDAGMEPCCGTDSEADESSEDGEADDSDIDYASSSEDDIDFSDDIELKLEDATGHWLKDGNGDFWRLDGEEGRFFEGPMTVTVYRSARGWLDIERRRWIRVTT